MSWILPACLGTALAAALTLTGCQREPATEPPTAAPATAGPAEISPASTPALGAEAAKAAAWQARGNEPFWMIAVEGDTLTWTSPDSESIVWTGLTRSERPDGFDLHAVREPHHLSVSATATVCRDSMASMPYPHTVTIKLDGKTLAGCGGDPMSLLAIGEWTVASVAGEPTGERPPTLQFLPEGRAAGFAGCNRWTSGTALSGEGVSFTQVATTMMACPEPAMAAERRFLEVLSRTTRHDFGADGSLQLIAGDTVIAVATRTVDG
ncbi:MAG: hypothetical protein KatS3mg128_0963 [Silanimonas sp.]|nr:MAG: hypothetical protein KatS3mg127_0934 [Silanimonas sp.]GIX39914.1 MAG: hypothetical protein KatS3mg128_0963 [Silanimonas sp.]